MTEKMLQELHSENPHLAALVSAAVAREQSRSRFYRWIAVAAVVLTAAVGAVGYSRALDNSDALRASQVAACRASVQPGGIRYIIADQLRTEVARSERLDYSRFFPSVPPDELRQLLDQQRDRQRAQIAALLNVDCEHRYAP